MKFILAALLSSFCVSAFAQADIGGVPLPLPRPVEVKSAGDGPVGPNTDQIYIPLPQRRPTVPTQTPLNEAREDAPIEPPVSDEDPRPPRIYQAACPAILSEAIDADILPPIANGVCQVQSPYLVRGLNVGGTEIGLSNPITVNCQMATQLHDWAGRVSAYAKSVFNSEVTGILTGTSYMCRPRNNRAGADVSEHGMGNALDVTGFVLANGQRLSLPDNWAGNDFAARTMRFAHDAACGHFTTVLGPEANALHADHLHVDLGCHGKTCSARLCE